MSSKFDEKRVLGEVQRLAALIQKDKASQPNERQTEAKYIQPLLEALGWLVAEGRLEHQYPVKGSVVDMALVAHGKPVAFVEAKRLRQDLSLKDTEAAQALQYGYESGTNWCVLTNGERYEAYDAFAKVEHAKKLVVAFSISEVAQHPEREMPKLRLLSYEAITGGELAAFAKRAFSRERVREALEKPPQALLAALVQELKHYGLTEGDVQEALREVLGVQPSTEATEAPPAAGRAVTNHDENDHAVWGIRTYGAPIQWLDSAVWLRRARPLKHDVVTDGVSHDSLVKVAEAVSALAAGGSELDRYIVKERAAVRSGGVVARCLGILWVAGLLELVHTDPHGREFLRLRKAMTAEEIVAAVRAKAEPAKP